MQPAKLAVMPLVLLVLPVDRRFVAEEDATPEGADRVDGAETIDLEGAIAFVRCRWAACGQRSRTVVSC